VTILGPALFKDEDDFNSFFHNKILLAANLFFVIFSIFTIIGYPYVVLSYVLIMEVILGYTNLSTIKEHHSEIISKTFSIITFVMYTLPWFLFFGLPSGFGGLLMFLLLKVLSFTNLRDSTINNRINSKRTKSIGF